MSLAYEFLGIRSTVRARSYRWAMLFYLACPGMTRSYRAHRWPLSYPCTDGMNWLLLRCMARVQWTMVLSSRSGLVRGTAGLSLSAMVRYRPRVRLWSLARSGHWL